MRIFFSVSLIGLLTCGCVEKNDVRNVRADNALPIEYESIPISDATESYPGFLPELALEAVAATSANASVGDLDMDGDLDVVLVKGRHWPLEDRVLFGDGSGEFTAGRYLSEIADRSYSGSLADLDLDGDLDIVISNDRPDPSLIYLNDGTGAFVIGSTFGKAEWPTRNASVADVNGDGFADVIVANRYGDNQGGNYICLNQGNAEFSEDCVLFSTESSTTITPADFDGNDLTDLVVPHRDGGQSYVYVQESAEEMSFRRVPFGPADAVIRASQVADFNGDGVLDIVAINAGMSEGDDGTASDRRQTPGVSIFLGETGGLFSTAIPIGNAGSVPYALSIGDLDLDGTTDIVVGHVEAPSVVYFNNGSEPGFTALQFGSAEGTVYGFGIGDLNEDGQPDIVAARSGAVNVIYFGVLARE